jgi:hypothetical protein
VADATHGWFYKPMGTDSCWRKQNWCAVRVH